MFRRSLHLLAFGAVALLGAVTPASAGGCCACGTPCAPVPVVQYQYQYQYVLQPAYVATPVLVATPTYVTPTYVVNQGPVYTGPGHYLAQPVEVNVAAPQPYPYVGGYYHHRTYERRYADPVRYRVHRRSIQRPYVRHQRVSQRPARLQRSTVIYRQPARQRVIGVTDGRRPAPRAKGPRRPLPQDLDPRK